MNIVELILDEEDAIGIEAISVVESPAIEEDFIALKNQEFKLAEVDKEKRILMGAALIPNKPIYRRNDDNEYYIYFSRDTVRKASELFFINGNQNNSTLEHQVPLTGLSVVESWIVESEKDKTRHYDMEVPVGTWMVSMKVLNDDVWNDYVKTGKVKGFSIEGYFADKAERPKDKTIKDDLEEEAQELVEELKQMLKGEQLESYADYPDAVSNNAKRGIELNKKVNNKWATQVGKVRAQQLAKKEAKRQRKEAKKALKLAKKKQKEEEKLASQQKRKEEKEETVDSIDNDPIVENENSIKKEDKREIVAVEENTNYKI